MLHSIATMTDVLRGDAGSMGLVSGVGMHMTKHVFGLYSTTPPNRAVERPDSAGVQARLDATPPVAIADHHDGPATVASYTVAHGRDGAPEWGLVLADIAPGTRAYGRVDDVDLLAALEADEWVGQDIELVADGDVNLVHAP
jgi:acetyl-CoA C-acetyltransferase